MSENVIQFPRSQRQSQPERSPKLQLFTPSVMESLRVQPVADDSIPATDRAENPILSRHLRSLAKSTRKTYRAAYRQIDAWLDGRRLVDESLSDWLCYLHDQGKAPSTINTASAAVKFREVALGRPDPVGPETRRTRRMYRREGARRGKGSAPGLSLSQIKTLIDNAAAYRSPWGPRNAAIIATMFYSGLRSAEIPALNVCDLDFENGSLMIHQSKADQYGRGAAAPFGKLAQSRVRAWLAASGITDGALFPAIQTNGLGGAAPSVTSRRMHPVHAGRIVKKCGAAAGFPRITSHSMRRSFAQFLSRSGLSDHQIAEVGRWSDTTMVLRYTKGTGTAFAAALSAFDNGD